MFNNILGNENIKKQLIDSIKLDKISHSYLFIGTQGIGKQMIAKEFAKMILCTDENKYCNKCKSCIEFETNNNPNFKIIEPNGNSIKIEQIRELQRKVSEKPIISSKKVYIINDSEKMTIEAQNCLLKTLEEPPEYVTIILIASSESLFLDTIKSRCMIIHFEKIKDDEISQFLKRNFNTEISNSVMLQACQGSIGKAIEIKDKQKQYEQIEKIVYCLEKGDIIDILNISEILYKEKENSADMLEYLNIILINLARKSNKYAKCIEIVEETKRRINLNTNYDISIDNMLFNMWEQVN